MIQLGDFVKYVRGNRIYRVTKVKGRILVLDEYYEADKSKIKKLNKFSLNDRVFIVDDKKVGLVTNIQKINDNDFSYEITIEDTKQVIKDLDVSELKLYENENRLCEEKSSVGGDSESGTSGQLLSGDCCQYTRKDSNNELRFNTSSVRIEGDYDNISLGRRCIYRSKNESARVRKGTRSTEGSSSRVEFGSINDIIDYINNSDIIIAK